MQKVLRVRFIHSVVEDKVFFTARALEDFTIDDTFVLANYPNEILRINRLEMYRKDVKEVPKIYGADVTMVVPTGITIEKGDVLFRI